MGRAALACMQHGWPGGQQHLTEPGLPRLAAASCIAALPAMCQTLKGGYRQEASQVPSSLCEQCASPPQWACTSLSVCSMHHLFIPSMQRDQSLTCGVRAKHHARRIMPWWPRSLINACRHPNTGQQQPARAHGTRWLRRSSHPVAGWRRQAQGPWAPGDGRHALHPAWPARQQRV